MVVVQFGRMNHEEREGHEEKAICRQSLLLTFVFSVSFVVQSN
jgi:hypothetical protein